MRREHSPIVLNVFRTTLQGLHVRPVHMLPGVYEPYLLNGELREEGRMEYPFPCLLILLHNLPHEMAMGAIPAAMYSSARSRIVDSLASSAKGPPSWPASLSS